MARVAYDGAPTVSADLEAPNDYQHEQASPNAFGAQTAEAIGGAGQAMQKLSDFYGQVSADNATNNYITQATALLRGDPSKGPLKDADGNPVVGPGGGPVYDGGYFSKQGADAMDARTDVGQSLDEIEQETRASLKTPEAQHQFDTQSRRYRAQYNNEIGQHYDQQYKQWMVNTASTSSELAESQAATSTDPSVLDQARNDIRNAEFKKYQAQYGSPGSPDSDAYKGVILHADQKWAIAQLRGAGDNGERAQQVLDANRSVLASLPNYDQIVRQTDGLVYKQQSASMIASAVNDAVGSAAQLVQGPLASGVSSTPDGAKPSAAQVSAAIGGQEWNGKGAAPTSVSGAVGPSQILPSTAVQYGLDPAKLSDPTYAAHARDVIVSKISALPNVQGDPARIAVGYFSGPGNIAPLDSPTPYVRDIADPTGKTTSSYVADVGKRLGQGAQYRTVPDAIEATAPQRVEAFREQAEQKWGATHPDWVINATDEFRRQINQSVADQRASYKVYTNVVQQVMAGDNPPTSEADLMSRGPQVAAAWRNMQVTNPSVAESMTHRWNEESKGRPSSYGMNFKDYADRALAPTTDPNHISDPMELNNFVGAGEEAPLTTAGQNQLAQIMSLRDTPQGEAFVGRVRNFMNYMHAELTYSNANAGQFDRKGEQLFAQASAQILPNILNAYRNGTADKVLDPNSPDFLGKVVTSMARPPAQVMKDRMYPEMSDVGLEKKFGTPQTQGYAILHEAVQQGRLTARQAAIIAAERGYTAPQHTTPAIAPTLGAPVIPAAPTPQAQSTPSPDSEG